MRKQLFISLFVCIALSSFAQKQIKQYEYWFDENYATKIVTPITGASSFILSTSVHPNQLSEGLHTFRIRFQDNKGGWSATTSQFFVKTPINTNHNITQYEYWFDNNYATKTKQSVSLNDTISLVSSIATNNLIEGLHTFQIRFQDKSGSWSATTNQFFIKTPINTNHNITQYEYWFDNNYAAKTKQTVTLSDTISLVCSIATNNLIEGLHTFQIRFQDKSGSWSATTNQFFIKTPINTNHNITQYEYWFDNNYAGKINQTVTLCDTISLISSITTNNLIEGLHTFQIRFQDKTGAWSSTTNQFFVKKPVTIVGGNKITAYRYWFNQDFSNQQTVNVNPVNPLILNNNLINMSSVTSTLVTPDNYEFYPNPINGHKVTYHGQSFFNIQFKDKVGQWSSVSVDTVKTTDSVSIACDTLRSNIPIIKNYPSADTIHFYMTKVIAGDSIVFKSSKPLIIDLYNPIGQKITTITKPASIVGYGFNVTIGGEYYALVHGFSASSSGFYSLNYNLIPKYCVLGYNKKKVGNTVASSIVFKGNGFNNNTIVTLTSGSNTLTSSSSPNQNGHELVSSFNFQNAIIGFYNINVNFIDTIIVIPNGLEVNSQNYAVLSGNVALGQNGNYAFAGVYEYDNLELTDNTTLLSYGISELVIKVKYTLLIGKNVAIRVRNGYYAGMPLHSASIVNYNNINSFRTFQGDGYSLYASTFGKGGNGGNGGNGGFGAYEAREVAYNVIVYYPGLGGGGGGGGAGGFGGGIGGIGGLGGSHSETSQSGTGYDGKVGLNGNNNGADGGSGGPGGYNTNYNISHGGTGGNAMFVGSSNTYTGGNAANGGGGGGGNGAYGTQGAARILGTYCSLDNGDGGGGGGAGGYGGGILVVSANSIEYDTTSKPYFLALGQNGGNGGQGGVGSTSGSNSNNGSNGINGECGLVIINTPNQIPDFYYSAINYGSNVSPLVGGHGLVSGTANVLYNVDTLSNSVNIISCKAKGELSLKINPNPANNKLFVNTQQTNLQNANISIYDIQGQQLLQQSISQSQTEINIQNLAKGIYIIKVINGNEVMQGKFVKE